MGSAVGNIHENKIDQPDNAFFFKKKMIVSFLRTNFVKHNFSQGLEH